MIPYGRQSISNEDIEAVISVLRSDFLTQGPKVPMFEKAIAEYCSAKHAIAVNSATSALHIACMVLDLGPGDLLWTSPITFVASANCGLYCGADVDFVDIDPHTYNMSPTALEAKLELAEAQGRLPKIVIPVHLAGQACDMKAIHQLSKKYGFYVIEDASHAIGGKYLGKTIGNCEYSDITIFSFHPVKIITTGEGGMALTNNPELAQQMERLRSHGISRDPKDMTRAPDGPWYYQQLELGYNFRMTDIQAALGLSQLHRLAEFIQQRRKIAERYDHMLKNLPIISPWQAPDSDSAYHLYIIRVDEDKRSHVFGALRQADINVNIHYIPVHTQPYYMNRYGFRSGDFPLSEEYYQQAISLPIYPDLSEEEQDYVVESLSRSLL